MRREKRNRPVELASAISGRPSEVAVTSQSTVAVLLALALVLALALALSFEPGSVIEYRTSEWLPAMVMPRLVFNPAKTRHPFLNFSYACPEPVLVRLSF